PEADSNWRAGLPLEWACGCGRSPWPIRLGRLGPPEMEALGVVDPEPADRRQRLLVLDSLGDGLLAEAAGDRDDRLDQLLVGRVLLQLADELDVDLQILSRDVLEVG